MKSIETVLRELTLADLRDWAGGTILGRARPYAKYVLQLSRTPEEALVAWVIGTDRYVTSVRIPKPGHYDHACTCPYAVGGPCKHAVALVLAAGEALKAGRSIPPLDPDGDLARALRGGPGDDASREDEEPEDEADEDDDDAERRGRTRRPARRRARQGGVEAALGKLDREQLLVLLAGLAAQHPEVERSILESDQLASGRISALERSLREEIRDLASEQAWYNPWKGTGNRPDYSHLQQQLRALGKQGHADAVLRLGTELWTHGRTQVEQSHDDGDTAMEIAECLGVVMQAVPHSSLAPSAQLLWIIDRELEDDYDLLAGADHVLDSRAYTKAHWREVAAALDERLNPGSGMKGAGFPVQYRRDRVLRRLLDACARAGWKDRIIPVLEAEADACQCYSRLVDELLAAGEQARAREWCIRGYASTINAAPGIAHELQNRLRDMARKRRRHDLVAAYAAQDFRAQPSLQGYRELQKAAERAKCWPAVREAALGYLESGAFPVPGQQWPLPAPEVEPPAASGKSPKRPAPDHDVLIRIAIAEQRHDDVVTLYRRRCQAHRWRGDIDLAVAQALAATHPDIALGIRRILAEELIARTKPSAYEAAAVHLRAMREIFTQQERVAEWDRLLADIRTRHRAKRRLLETLDTLTATRIAG